MCADLSMEAAGIDDAETPRRIIPRRRRVAASPRIAGWRSSR
jgi:hypothetical protein